jgi:hypothetical protein
MDIPVIMSPYMVDALLADQKIMTRRLAWVEGKPRVERGRQMTGFRRASIWQRVKPGDRLWVRERHWRCGVWRRYYYAIGETMRWRFVPRNAEIRFKRPRGVRVKRRDGDVGWWLRPSIFHSRALTRLTLVVTATRLERLHAITEADCLAEGAFIADASSQIDGGPMVWLDPKKPWFTATPRAWYRTLWDELHGDGSWDSNPEVVVVSFSVRRQNIDQVEPLLYTGTAPHRKVADLAQGEHHG